jgi:histidinol-phosphate aminotransferase
MSLRALARPDLWQQSGYRDQGLDDPSLLRLHCNENPWPPAGASDPLINRYPQKQPPELVQRLAGLYEISPRNLLITRGADDGIDALIRAFCRPAEDAIAQCSPAFVMYRFFARLQAVPVIDVPLDASDGFAVDFGKLLAVSQARIFFVCNPNNPTGSAIDQDAILEFASRVRERALVVVDEAYIEFANVRSLAREATVEPNLVVLRTLSKAWSLAGARLGVVIGTDELIDYLHATTSPYPLSRASVDVALAATDPHKRALADARLAELRQQRQRLGRALQEFEFVQRIYPSQANFLLLQVDGSARLLDFMRQRGILLRDQSAQPNLRDHLRISIGRPPEMDRLLEAFGQYQEVLRL